MNTDFFIPAKLAAQLLKEAMTGGDIPLEVWEKARKRNKYLVHSYKKIKFTNINLN